MTCSHCVAAVTEEVARLDGVSAVDVDLNAGGDSRVTVTSTAPLPVDAVARRSTRPGTPWPPDRCHYGDPCSTAHAPWSEEVRGMTQQAVDLQIGGMTCASCAARIEKKLNRMAGVQASVNYATEKAHVVLPEGTGVDAAIATVEATGYTATPARATAPPTAAGDAGVDRTPVEDAGGRPRCGAGWSSPRR